MAAYIQHVVAVCESLKNVSLIKIAGAGLFSVYAFLFGVDVPHVLMGLVTLTAIDFVTAIAAAKKTGEAIQSAKALRSAFKIWVYSLLTIAANLADVSLLASSFPINIKMLLLAYLSVSELISILENASKANISTPARLLN